MRDVARREIEDQMVEVSPGLILFCLPCLGGPVGTVEKFLFLIPASQHGQVKDHIQKYKELSSHPAA